MRLRNRTALVTGGAGGIGREICLAYAAEGARVAVNYNGSKEEAERLAAEIASAGGEAIAIRCDVSDEAQVNAMVDQLAERWQGVDILVNNAAMYPRKPWHEITSEEWDRVMGVNVKSCFLTAKAVFPYMKERGYGKIINVSSVTFWRGQAGFLHYVTSKGGIIGFTRALAREAGGSGITVNCITPGAVLTEQERRDFTPEALEQAGVYLAKEQSLPRRQMPTDMSGSFLFLASPDSDFITGQTLNVDGGWMMH